MCKQTEVARDSKVLLRHPRLTGEYAFPRSNRAPQSVRIRGRSMSSLRPIGESCPSRGPFGRVGGGTTRRPCCTLALALARAPCLGEGARCRQTWHCPMGHSSRGRRCRHRCCGGGTPGHARTSCPSRHMDSGQGLKACESRLGLIATQMSSHTEGSAKAPQRIYAEAQRASTRAAPDAAVEASRRRGRRATVLPSRGRRRQPRPAMQRRSPSQRGGESLAPARRARGVERWSGLRSGAASRSRRGPRATWSCDVPQPPHLARTRAPEHPQTRRSRSTYAAARRVVPRRGRAATPPCTWGGASRPGRLTRTRSRPAHEGGYARQRARPLMARHRSPPHRLVRFDTATSRSTLSWVAGWISSHKGKNKA